MARSLLLALMLVGLSCVYDSAAGWGCRRGRPSTMESFWKVEQGKEDAFRVDLRDCQRRTAEFEGRTTYGDVGVGGGPGSAREMRSGWDPYKYGEIQQCMEAKDWVPK